MANIGSPNSMAQCGCGMRGTRTLSEPMMGSLTHMGRLASISADNTDTTHDTAEWWCTDHHMAEWMCLNTGRGRHHGD